jgi:hypothetical protein
MDLPAPRLRYPVETPPPPGEAVEIAEGVLWLRLPLPMKLDHVNVFALDDGDGWTVVDTGFDTPRPADIWETALSGPLAGRPVRRVLVTHYHPDHIGLAGWFQARGAELWTTRTSWLLARMLARRTAPAGARDGGVLDLRRHGPGHPRPADGRAALQLLRRGGAAAARLPPDRRGRDPAHRRARLGRADGRRPCAGARHALEPRRERSSWAATSSCRRSRPTSASMRPSPRPIRWATGSRRANGSRPTRPTTSSSCRATSCPTPACPPGCASSIENHEARSSASRRICARAADGGRLLPPLFLREIGPGEYGLALVEAMAHCLHLWHRGIALRERRADGAWLWRVP